MSNDNRQGGVAVSRKSFRFDYSAPVDILRGSERYSFGVMLNVSRGGAAFRAYAPVLTGVSYTLCIRGVGSYPGTIVRQFNGDCYAARFDVEEGVKRRIDKALVALFGVQTQNGDERARFSA